MAKTMEDLQKSREIRKEVISKYGEVPKSVWHISYANNKLVWDPRTRQSEIAHKDTSGNKELETAWSLSGRSVRQGAESTMPYDMVERVLKFYSEPGETFLDPTMGDMAVMTASHYLNRNFIGYDISETNFNINKELKEKFEKRITLTEKASITIFNKSSESMSEVADNTVDLVFFSPPYWDLEFYGEEAEQLGYGKTYEEFLAGLGRVIKECYRVMKEGKYCAININDFTKGGHLYDYHMDVKNLMDEAGFKRHDTIIIEWPNCIGQAFASQVEDRKKTAKTHEYIIVGKKVPQ